MGNYCPPIVNVICHYTGGIVSLVKLLNHEDVEYKSGAIQAIASLVSGLPSNCKLVPYENINIWRIYGLCNV